MSSKTIYLWIIDQAITAELEGNVFRPAGYKTTLFTDAKEVAAHLRIQLPDILFLGEQLAEGNGFQVAGSLLESYPCLSIILVAQKAPRFSEVEILRKGIAGYLTAPFKPDEVLQMVSRITQRSNKRDEWFTLQAKRHTQRLEMRLAGLEAIARIGRSVTSILDLDKVLSAVVDSAVELTGAEEGSLLLIDDTTGELYMRAARNFQDEFVRTFRLPIRDTLPGQVLHTGKPLVIDEKIPRKIKTSYLVHSLIYVPLQLQGRGIGVLGVDHRHSGHSFSEQQVNLMLVLADYAAIAIENANLYSRTEVERKKLETVLTHVEDGVIVLDHDNRVILLNHTMRAMFNIQEQAQVGKLVQDVILHTEMLEFFENGKSKQTCRTEIHLEDGRVYNAQLTPIREVGMVVTMQDITHLKELDRIKSEFVNTVSHDLRSPLTAILGYIELLERVGPLTDAQREFVRRVQLSVNNITLLISELLDLGRIEAGFDALKEIVPFAAIVRYAVESLNTRLRGKQQELTLDIAEDLPTVLGNPGRLRQMVSNLVGNAITYTQTGGKISVCAKTEENQIIFSVSDNGPGIPPSDQPYIFDKFYRASNVPPDVQGTGLGLAIVKSIVENHQGRIWANSTLGQGTTFTVVLPIDKGSLNEL